MARKRWFIDIALIVIIVLLGTLVVIQLTERSDKKAEQAATPTSPAEDVTPPSSVVDVVPTEAVVSTSQPASEFELMNLEGETISLADFIGQPVVINFWATWCPPCRAEMPIFEEYAKIFQDEMIFLAVNGGEEEEVVRRYVEGYAFQNIIFLLDPQTEAANHYRIRGLPTTLFVDAQGILQSTHIGQLDGAILRANLEKVGITE